MNTGFPQCYNCAADAGVVPSEANNLAREKRSTELKLTRQDIESVAYLSRLQLSEEEKDKLTTQINRLLGNFEKLQEINTDDVEPTSHVIPVSNVFRKDESRPSLPAEEVVSNGPRVAGGCFVVPRVVEK